MEQHVSAPNNDPHLDEEIWLAWVHKNEARDRLRFEKRKKLLVLVVMLGIAVAVFWRIAQVGR